MSTTPTDKPPTSPIQALAPAPDDAVREQRLARELVSRTLGFAARQTDRLFAGLLVAEWLASVVLALTVSPSAWEGKSHYLHPHVWEAIFLELAVISLPVALGLLRPGWFFTRHAIAAAQMLTSAVLIHVTGGRIETHFHIFGSLAFLAFYWDWRVLVTATAVVAVDHLLRGLFVPLSVFGVVSASPWRWLEHAGWVVFEDAFLIRACLMAKRLVIVKSRREARLEIQQEKLVDLTRSLDRKVVERTAALEESMGCLRDAQAQLVVASREAGRADVATTVLHNVGNVLNSVNVSAEQLRGQLERSRVLTLPKAIALMTEHRGDLGDFFANDVRGKKLPDYLAKLSDGLLEQHEVMRTEVLSLQKNVDHIKVIVGMQQSHAKARAGMSELLSLDELLEDALRVEAHACQRDRIEVVRRYGELPKAELDRHKVLQIVMNLLSNARQSLLEEGARGPRRITVGTRQDGERCCLFVEDTGSGIAEENQKKIFTQGFTTKKDGHGFGLHGAACAAAELGGSLAAFSEGTGRGAVFTLELPLVALRKAS